MGISAIRAALAAQLDTIPGLRATPVATGTISPPIAIVAPATGPFAVYDETFDGAVAFVFDVTLLVSLASDRVSQQLLDSYLDATGAESVLACLQQAPTTLGGLVSYCTLVSAQSYGNVDYGGVTYFGAKLTVQVGAP